MVSRSTTFMSFIHYTFLMFVSRWSPWFTLLHGIYGHGSLKEIYTSPKVAFHFSLPIYLNPYKCLKKSLPSFGLHAISPSSLFHNKSKHCICTMSLKDFGIWSLNFFLERLISIKPYKNPISKGICPNNLLFDKFMHLTIGKIFINLSFLP